MSVVADSPREPGDARARRWWAACAGVLVLSLAAILPTLGDMGLTYDEPAYRYSQMISSGWWERMVRARGAAELGDMLAPDSLFYYWPYARRGENFHPPLAGQLNLLSWELSHRWLADIPARRLATALGYAAAVAVLFGFLGWRYGAWVGLGAAGALLTMPRVYGQAHLIDTDTPGMALWLFTAVAFWKGLHDPGARRWRWLVGVLAGLAFVQKLGAVLVVAPLLGWLVVGRLVPFVGRKGTRGAWLSGLAHSTLLLVPLALAYAEIVRLAAVLPRPEQAKPFEREPASWLPGAILAGPLAIHLLLKLVPRRRPARDARVEVRPGLEIWFAILTLGPVVAWLGNPGWWRHTLPRLAHYYQLCTARRGALPDIWNLYHGDVYVYSLPWHSAWALIAITVPATLLVAAVAGLFWGMRRAGSGDRLPLFFLLLFATTPLMRLGPTPAHDGVRLFLPCFPFLAAFAGSGVGGIGRALSRRLKRIPAAWTQALVLLAALGPAAWEAARIHPYELSYYNALVGGPRGAQSLGFELSYWFDAFTPRVLADLRKRLPPNAGIAYANERSNPQLVMPTLQALGEIRPDVRISGLLYEPGLPYLWLLTHDSKASSFDRLLFAMTPWYESRPRQLDGLRVLTVADPRAVSRALALHLLVRGPAPSVEILGPAAPEWVRQLAPPLAFLWGDGLERVEPLRPDERALAWAKEDPEGLLAAARWIADGKPAAAHEGARRLMDLLRREQGPGPGSEFVPLLLKARPEAVLETARMLVARPDAVRRVLEHPTYLDPRWIGGPLDAER